jgi:hypothetical protein
MQLVAARRIVYVLQEVGLLTRIDPCYCTASSSSSCSIPRVSLLLVSGAQAEAEAGMVRGWELRLPC